MAPKRKSKAIRVIGEIVEEENGRNAPMERHISGGEIVDSVMNDAQLRIILGKTPDYAKKKREGPSGRILTYVTHGYVTDQLNKAFGMDWDIVLKPMSDGKMFALEAEPPVGSAKVGVRHLAVCGDLIIRIHNKKGNIIATITKSGFGSQIWRAGMELGDALKAARSDLIKTCAFQLGIALDLYWNDRAELEGYEKRVKEETADREAAAAVQKAVNGNGVPVNPVMLISRAASEFKLDLEGLLKFSAMTEEDLFSANEKQIRVIWENLSAYENTGKK